MPQMPVHPASSDDPFEDRGMPGLELADPAWAMAFHEWPSMKAHKPLPRKRDYIDSLEYVTSLPLNQNDFTKHEARAIAMEEGLPIPSRPFASPAPPLTPPSGLPEPVQEEHVEHAHALERQSSRAGAITPMSQNKPPTPDITPPRLGASLHHRAQPSLSSRAESFRTAREEISSDDGSEDGWRSSRPTPWGSALRVSTSVGQLSESDAGETPRKSRLRNEVSNNSMIKMNGSKASPTFQEAYKLSSAASSTVGGPAGGSVLHHGYAANGSLPSPPTSDHSQMSPVKAPTSPLGPESRAMQESPKQIEESSFYKQTKEFEKAIARVPSDHAGNRIDTWRYSGVSTTSTVEAIVVDTVLPKHQKLRHTRKNASLRSASSPMPQSNRTSWNSNGSYEQHRLVRRPARLTNENRWSLNSDISRAMSNVSNAPSSVPRQELEVIPVVVVPQRKSSLKSSSNSSRRQSQNSGQRPSTDSADSPPNSFRNVTRKRAMSDSVHDKPKSTLRTGRDRQYPPAVPARTSSLSAPTSRNGSRSSSLTSEGLRMRRLAAEDDVHKALAKMESRRSKESDDSQVIRREQLPASLTTAFTKPRPVHPPKESSEDPMRSPRPVTPSSHASGDSGHLRPPSMPFTPFSQHSVLTSSSPGTVEIHEATAINYFPHNNHSLQLIERRMFPESQLVRPLGDRRRSLTTPEQTRIPDIVLDSPLKNPRDAPQPPAVKIIPPTPGLTPTEEYERELEPEPKNVLSRGLGSVKRAFSTRNQSEPFRPTFVRTLSTTKARNKKLEQNLDGNLHPFWRPRGFWDEYSETDSNGEGLVVNNSLGMLQPRVIFQGPLSVVRRLSERRRQRDRVTKRASRTNVGRGRMYTRSMAGLGTHLQFLRLRNIQDRLLEARERRDEQKREKRRTELRKSIGHNIQPQGDSRFPMSPPGTRNGALGAGLPIQS